MTRHLDPGLRGAPLALPIDVALRLLPEEAIAEFGRCVADATSVVGLRPLVRAYPRDWHRLVVAWVRPKVRVVPQTALREILVSGVLQGTMPRHAGAAETIRRDRASARLVVEVFGDLRVDQIRASHAGELRERLLTRRRQKTGRPVGAASLARAEQVFRRVTRWAQNEIGVVPSLSSRGPRTRTPGWRRSRSVPTGQELEQILARIGTLRDRTRVALVAGGGLTEAELDRMTRGDVVDLPRLWLPTADRRRGRVVVLPPWASDQLGAWLTRQGDRLAGARLFQRGPSSRRALRRACRVEVYDMMSLRRMYQAGATAAGAARGSVRGSLSLDSSASPTWKLPSLMPAMVSFASSWSTVRAIGSVRVPQRRARCGVLEPEFSARCWQALPRPGTPPKGLTALPPADAPQPPPRRSGPSRAPAHRPVAPPPSPPRPQSSPQSWPEGAARRAPMTSHPAHTARQSPSPSVAEARVAPKGVSRNPGAGPIRELDDGLFAPVDLLRGALTKQSRAAAGDEFASIDLLGGVARRR